MELVEHDLEKRPRAALLALFFTHPYTPLRILSPIKREFIERFHSRSQHLGKCRRKKENFYVGQEFNSHRIFWNTNMAAV